jgi:hypothetical protein
MARMTPFVAGGEVVDLVRQQRSAIDAWLKDRRDETELREQRLETLEWAILLFVGMEVLYDFGQLTHWLSSRYGCCAFAHPTVAV